MSNFYDPPILTMIKLTSFVKLLAASTEYYPYDPINPGFAPSATSLLIFEDDED